MNASQAPANATAIDRSELVGLQRAGAFLSQRQQHSVHHAHSPPMAIPPPQHCANQFMYEPSDESLPLVRQANAHCAAALAQDPSTASSSFLAAIRRNLHDNSPSWDNNGWFIGDDSDDDDNDDDFYSSMRNPYGGATDTTVFGECCAPAGSFARFTDAQTPLCGDFATLNFTATANGTIQREGSLIFAMEV